MRHGKTHIAFIKDPDGYPIELVQPGCVFSQVKSMSSAKKKLEPHPMEKVDIYLEIACLQSPGVSGWGVVVSGGKTYKKMSGGDSRTTHNRMYLTAAVTAMEALEASCEGRLHTESKYLCDGITTWIVNWEKRGWKTAKKKPVENADLWKRLKEAAGRHQIEWVWTPKEVASSGYEREDAVELARKAMEEHSR